MPGDFIPAIKEQSHSQKDREELPEPPSQVYSLQLCHYAAYSFALAKKNQREMSLVHCRNSIIAGTFKVTQ